MAPLSAKNRKSKSAAVDPKDEISVVGHIPLSGAPISRFFATRHYSSFYLYAEHTGGGRATLVDVTQADSPVVLADVAYAPKSESLSLVAGTAALVISETAPSVDPASQSIRIMDFSDPKNPKVARELTGVTAMSRGDRRGLIFVANADGLWILQQKLAEDPEVERAYAHYVIYGSSMYPPK